MRRWVAYLKILVLGVAALSACATGATPKSGSETEALTAEVVASTPTLTATPVKGMPADVPLHPKAYAVQVMRPGALVVYRVDESLEEVMRFYVSSLPLYGWQQPSPSDAVVGAAATLMRFKTNGDQLVLSLRYKPNEGATIVAISVKRGKR